MSKIIRMNGFAVVKDKVTCVYIDVESMTNLNIHTTEGHYLQVPCNCEETCLRLFNRICDELDEVYIEEEYNL